MSEKRNYSMRDLEEQELSTAPSLDLPAFEVERFYMPKDGGKLMVFFANVKRNWVPADGFPCCHKTDKLTRSGRSDPRIIRDVTRNNYNTLIVTESPRMECKRCGQRFTPVIDGIVENRMMTERLLDFLKIECFLQAHTVLQERTGVSLATIQNIMDEEIEKYDAQRLATPIEAPEVLGVDEKHIQNNMRGTLVDVRNGHLLDMLESNDKVTMAEAIKKLKDWDKNIRVVTTDMANSYLSWMPQFLPNATFVVDKFHVFQDVSRKLTTTKIALYAYRKELIANMPDGDEKQQQYYVLYLIDTNRRLFNFSTETLVRQESGELLEILDTVINKFPEFKLLRMIYFGLENIYSQTTRADAEKAWDEWQELLPPGTPKAYEKWCELYDVDPACFEAFRSLTRKGFTKFKPYILNYFNDDCRFTNATTEGLNSLIQSINAAGNGYKFKHLRAKALYASLIHEKIVYSLDIKTVKSWKPDYSYQGFSMMTETMFSGSSHGSYVTKKKYVFGQRRSSLYASIPSVLSDNLALISSLEGDDAEYEDSTRKLNEKSAINAYNRMNEYMY